MVNLWVNRRRLGFEFDDFTLSKRQLIKLANKVRTVTKISTKIGATLYVSFASAFWRYGIK